VARNGWTARFPADWELERTAGRLAAERPDGAESVAVATFPLRRRFRADLWDEAVAELDVVARDLAQELSALAQLSNGINTSIDGRRARSYEIRYERDGIPLIERVAFVFEGRREFQLTCRIDEREPEPGEAACSELLASFAL
jgi:hypothetical protein